MYFYVTDLIIVAILFLWRIRIFKDKIKMKYGRPEIFLGIFLIIAGLSVVFAQNKLIAVYGFLKLIELAALFFYVKYNWAALYSLKSFWRWFVAGAILQSAVAINQFFVQKSLGLKIFAESPLASNINGVAKIVVGGEKIVRAYGLVPHPNILAAILMIGIFGIVYLFVRKCQDRDFLKKTYALAILTVLSVALFLTFSRSVIVISFIFLMAWLLILCKNKEYRKPVLIVFLLLLIVYCLLFIAYWSYFSARYDVGALANSQSLNLRFFYNQEALRMIEQKPVLGVGQGNFVWSLMNLTGANLEPWMWQPVHNIYLLIASETGLLGLFAFLGFLFLIIKGVWQRRKDLFVSCFLFLVSCLFVIGLFDHFLWDLQQGQILFWLMLGLLSSFCHSDPAVAGEESGFYLCPDEIKSS